MAHAYCTYFDHGYLSRALALIATLREHNDEAEVWVMALDDAVAEYFDHTPVAGVRVVRVGDLEQAVPGLARLKSERSRMEYYFTTTPLLIRYVMDASGADAIAYLDADLAYFDDPATVFAALGEHSVGIIEHRYPGRLAKRLAKYGRFNVGWVGFRNDARGRACLDWWGRSTLEWCRDTPEDGKYADQGYLDRFPEFDGVGILGSAGFDLAPWNTGRHRIAASDGRVTADGDPLVFFHFHGLRRAGGWWVSSQLVYGAPMGAILRDLVYRPYAARLDALEAGLSMPAAVAKRGTGLRGVAFRAQKAALTGLSIVTGNAVRAGLSAWPAARSR